MQARDNPFSPGAGSLPPELVGREGILEQAVVLLARVKRGRSEKSIILTGLRGVGKTVLLNKVEELSYSERYRPVFIEATEENSLAALLVPKLRTLLFELGKIKGSGNKVRRALAVLRGFIGTIGVSAGDFRIDIEPERGVADSGDLNTDLTNLLVELAKAVQEKNSGVVILVDEIQYLKKSELGALIMAMHRLQQLRLPIVLVAAGLPTLPGLAGEIKSYSERLFAFPDIGPLSKEDTVTALRKPVQANGVDFNSDALDEIFNQTQGYPYFIQEWGYQAWNHAQSPEITAEVVHRSAEIVKRRLDESFFRVRFDRLTPREKEFLRSMAEIRGEYKRSSEIARVLKMKDASIGPHRSSLIKKGMIYSPSYGNLVFTVPLFGEFMKRALPDVPANRSLR